MQGPQARDPILDRRSARVVVCPGFFPPEGEAHFHDKPRLLSLRKLIPPGMIVRERAQRLEQVEIPALDGQQRALRQDSNGAEAATMLQDLLQREPRVARSPFQRLEWIRAVRQVHRCRRDIEALEVLHVFRDESLEILLRRHIIRFIGVCVVVLTGVRAAVMARGARPLAPEVRRPCLSSTCRHSWQSTNLRS